MREPVNRIDALDLSTHRNKTCIKMSCLTSNIGNHLEVRLVNGPNNGSGRVEVHVRYNARGTWGTVCDDGWDLNDANVVCRMLGFFRASSAPVMAAYGAGYGEIHLDEVECTGSENSLEDCIKSKFGDHDCTHFEDAGVICEGTVTVRFSILILPTVNNQLFHWLFF